MYKKVFSAILSCVLIFNYAHASDCNNDIYRYQNPEKCSKSNVSWGTATAVTGGALALIGGTVALIAKSGGGSESPTTNNNNTQYIPSSAGHVGADIDTVQLSALMHTHEYTRNVNQYNDIRLAYSLARGYTGKNSVIAVFDAAPDSWHGSNVANLSSGHIAPDATIKSYQVAKNTSNFYSFEKIATVIDQAAPNAHIFNFSWSATNSFATEIKSRKQLESMTSPEFISSLSNATTEYDTIHVWAAGNDYYSQSSALSALPRVVPELDGHFVNVVAWDSATGQLAEFSNACGITQDYCISAPGTNIITDTSSTPLNGTSFAAPVVSAAIAVLREAFPYMTATQITQLLFTTARDVGAPGTDPIYGHGLLDMERATRPVGVALVPISADMNVPLQDATVSGSIAHQIQSQGIQLAFIDSFGRAFTTNLNDNISVRNRGLGLEHLQENATLSMNIGNFEIGFQDTNILVADSFLRTNDKNTMSFVKYTGGIKFGDTEIIQQSKFGILKPRAAVDSLINQISNIYTASVMIGVQHQDFGLSIGLPDTIINGSMNLRTPMGRRANGEYLYQDYTIELRQRPSIEYTIRYRDIVMGFVDNAYGTDEFYILAKTKIEF